MVTRIGKIIFFLGFTLVCAQQVNNTVTLRIADMQGSPIKQAALGVPFVIETIVAGPQVPLSTPVVERLKHFHIEHQGLVSTISSTINGVSSEKRIYRYIVRADKEGTFIVGPAIVNFSSGSLRSAELSIVVSKHVTPKRPQEVMLQFIADKPRVMIGQEVVVSIRFYYNSLATLIGVSEPIFNSFIVSPLKGPVAGCDIIDGQDVDYLEWSTVIVPQKEGEFTIPALKALYKVDRTSKNPHGFDMFAAFFNGSFEQKTIYSNALQITVDPLPAHQGPVHGVGNFYSMKAVIEQPTARVGEGIVFKLEVMGSGNFDSFQIPALALPKEFAYYDSKHFVEKDPLLKKNKKIFEYVLQAKEPGVFKIPEQSFVYFDIRQNKYVTLASEPLEVTIKANDPVYVPDDTAQKSPVISDIVPAYKEAEKGIPLNYTGPWKTTPRRGLSMELFMGILSGLIIVYGLLSLMPYWIDSRLVRKRRMFSKATQRLKKASYAGECAEIYTIFIDLCADIFKMPASAVTLDIIREKLRVSKTLSSQEEAWQKFFDKVMACKFLSNERSTPELFQESFAWINRLKELL